MFSAVSPRKKGNSLAFHTKPSTIPSPVAPTFSLATTTPIPASRRAFAPISFPNNASRALVAAAQAPTTTTRATVVTTKRDEITLPVRNILNPMEGVQQIYYINLTRCFDRRAYIQALFEKPIYSGCEVTRIPGCDGARDPLTECIAFDHNPPNPRMTASEYGCTISHFRAIHEFAKTDQPVALIVEDDVSDEYTPYWTRTLEQCMQNAPPDWEVLQLSYIVEGPLPTHEYVAKDLSKNISGTAAYVIKNSAAKRLVAYLCGGTVPMETPVERQLYTIGREYPFFHQADVFIYNYLRSYCLRTPPFTYRDHNDSVIHPSHLTFHENSKRFIWRNTYQKG